MLPRWLPGLMFALGAAPSPASAAWHLVHDLGFNTAALDTTFWSLETGQLRNQELQYYTPGNVRVNDGMLTIEARKQDIANPLYRPGSRTWRTKQQTVPYTSGSVVSRAEFRFVRVEVVARTPSGAGVWPAIWLVHEGAKQYGEIDFFEAVGKHRDTAFFGVHWGREARTRLHKNASRVIRGFENAWHTHVLEWQPDRIAMSVDGQPVFSFHPDQAKGDGLDPLRQPMRLHINLALGGTWGGPLDESALPARFDIRSVKIWEWRDGAGDSFPLAADVRGVPPPPEPQPELPAAPLAAPRWGR